jgi:hypothetical protein
MFLSNEQFKLIQKSKFRYCPSESGFTWFRGTKEITVTAALKFLRGLVGDDAEEIPDSDYETAAMGNLVEALEPNVEFINDSKYLQHFWWRASDGVLSLYYSPTKSNELCPLPITMEESYRPLLNAIREVPEWLSQFVDDYERFRAIDIKLTIEAFASRLFKQLCMSSQQRLNEEPVPLTWATDVKAFKVFNPNILVGAETPAWDEFLNRLSVPDIFLSFIWSIYEPNNFGRQVLWLHGPGNDGKSRVVNALSKYVGLRAVAAISQGNTNSQFFNSAVYGKRLAVFGDCMNTRLISTNAIHTLVGGDTVSVEGKGKQAFPGRVFCRVVVGSNYPPEIDNTPNQTSRLLYLRVSPLQNTASNSLPAGDDASFEGRLLVEMPALLTKAKMAYLRRCPNNGRIEVSKEEFEAMMLHAKSEIQEFIEQFCTENMRISEGKSEDCAAVTEYFTYLAKTQGRLNVSSLDTTLLNRYIEERLKVSKIRGPNNRRVWLNLKMSTAFETYQKRKILEV